MAFQNIKFPDIKLKHGISKTVLDPVVVTGNGAREVRRRTNKFERFVWSYPGRTMTEADKHAVYTFLRGVNMEQDSFLLRDPTQPSVVKGKLAYNGTPTYWVMAIPFSSTQAGTHPLFRPDLSTLVVYRNGVVEPGAMFDTSYLDTQGRPRLYVPGSVPTDNIQISCDVYLTVRLSGTLAWSIAAMTKPAGSDCAGVTPIAVDLGDFSLIEVYE